MGGHLPVHVGCLRNNQHAMLGLAMETPCGPVLNEALVTHLRLIPSSLSLHAPRSLPQPPLTAEALRALRFVVIYSAPRLEIRAE